MSSLSNTELIDDGSGESELNQFLTPKEQLLMAILSEKDFDLYLQASTSEDKLEQYLLDSDISEYAKALIKSKN